MMSSSDGCLFGSKPNGEDKPVSTKKKHTPMAHISAAGVNGFRCKISGALPASKMDTPYLLNVDKEY